MNAPETLGRFINATRVIDLLNKAKQGDCWCGVGIGIPYMGSHTPQCKEIQAFLKEHKAKSMSDPRIQIQEHWTDENGRPAGGVTSGQGFTISWQNGPLGRGDERKEPNGAFVEDILVAAARRIEFYQATEFACEENKEALEHIGHALFALRSRTANREKRDVEGTYET